MTSVSAFTEHPVLTCIRLVPSVFSGIEKVVAFYYDSRSGLIENACLLSSNNYEEVEFPDFKDARSLVMQMRDSAKVTNWYASGELDFDVKEQGASQLSIYDEKNKNILRLCFPSLEDGKHDIIFIYFSSLLNILPMAKGKKKLEATDKSIIQHMCEKMFGAILQKEYSNRLHFDTMSRTARHIVSEAGDAKRKLHQSREKYGNSILNLCEMHLRKAEEKYNKQFRFEFEQDAIQSIKSYNGKLDDLERTIYEAADYLASIYANTHSQVIRIGEFALQFEQVNEKKAAELSHTGFTKEDSGLFASEIFTLNRYEEATSLVLKAGKKVTLKTVGAYCKPVITGAAVSDGIKSNIVNFKKLFAKYPYNWPLIKEHLTPLNNKLTVVPMSSEHKKQSHA